MNLKEKSAIYEFANEIADSILNDIACDKRLSTTHFDQIYCKVSHVHGGAAWDRAFDKAKWTKTEGIQSIVKMYENIENNEDYINLNVEPIVDQVCYERWLEWTKD